MSRATLTGHISGTAAGDVVVVVDGHMLGAIDRRNRRFPNRPTVDDIAVMASKGPGPRCIESDLLAALLLDVIGALFVGRAFFDLDRASPNKVIALPTPVNPGGQMEVGARNSD